MGVDQNEETFQISRQDVMENDNETINVSKSVPNVRKFGSAALDIANVACGRFDGYWQRELNYWDIAAGIIILKEAGGLIDFFEPQSF